MNKVKNVVEWLDESALKYPNKTAFSDGKNALSFSELRYLSRSIATNLAKKGFFKHPVFIKLDKNPKTIAAFLACAYSGNFYIPIDVYMPQERIDKIIKRVNINNNHTVLIDADNFKTFSDTNIDDKLLQEVLNKQVDTDLLYVLFTSGSTGEPKGVAIQHKSVIEYTLQINKVFKFNSSDIHGQAVPVFFDSSILPIYQTIYTGATDFLIQKKTLMFPNKLVEFLNVNKINSIYWVPTSYNILASSKIFTKHIPQHLNKCLFMGEVMPTKVLNTWRRYIPDAMYANLFGPTESTDTFLYYIVDRQFKDEESIPIGLPYNNIDVLLLNENNQVCSKGEIGELCVRGNKISCGYYNDAAATNRSFVQNPLNSSYNEIIYRTGDLAYLNNDNLYTYVGRKDFQIKHSGHRIELCEIESCAVSCSGIDLCSCVFDKVKDEISLFYTGFIDENELRKRLKTKLQPYMIPSKITKLDSMPRTSTGKIDRVLLKNQYI